MKQVMMSVITMVVAFLFYVPAPASQAEVVASVNTAGGMPGPGGGCYARHLDVFADGKVIETRCGKEPRLILTFAKTIMDKLVNLQKTLKDLGPLVPQDPKAPECADAASTVYSAFTNANVEVKLGGNINCRSVLPTYSSNEGSQLRTVLESLDKIDWL